MTEKENEINLKFIDYYLYNIDIEILRILNKYEGQFIHYYEIYNEIIMNMDIYEDSINDFKCIFIFYLVRMHIINKKVFIHVQWLPVGLVPDAEPLESGACERLNQNDVLKPTYYLCINKKDDENKDEHKDEQSKERKNSEETYNFKNKDYNKSMNKELDLPSSYEALCYFVDCNIRKYMNYVDYEGNNIIHILAINSDVKRLSKILYRYQYLFLEMNDYYETPIDLVTDIKISNLFTRLLLESSSQKNNELMMLQNDINQMKNYILLFALSYGIFYIMSNFISNIFIVGFN
jgi:hypothetical protein